MWIHHQECSTFKKIIFQCWAINDSHSFSSGRNIFLEINKHAFVAVFVYKHGYSLQGFITTARTEDFFHVSGSFKTGVTPENISAQFSDDFSIYSDDVQTHLHQHVLQRKIIKLT